MKYLSTLIWGCCIALVGFSQSQQTVTLVFVSSANDTKNYEAVIDDVSYYSENAPGGNSTGIPAGDRNTIWLNNFQAGQHTIQVYKIKNGSNEERAGNTPVYSSTFTVREGFDTKIAVRGNGQVQFSERQSTSHNTSINFPKGNNDVNTNDNNSNTSDTNVPDRKMNNEEKNNSDKNDGDAANQPVTNNDPYNNKDFANNNNTDVNERHSRKRIDTATRVDGTNDNNVTTKRNSTSKTSQDNTDSNGGFDDQNTDENNKAPMSNNQFNHFYETLRNQWLPGQKMKTLSNEFLNGPDYFTTSQAKQLIQLVNEEGNRLKLAKSVYHCITDPENFSSMDDILRTQTSRDELDDFVKNDQD